MKSNGITIQKLNKLLGSEKYTVYRSMVATNIIADKLTNHMSSLGLLPILEHCKATCKTRTAIYPYNSKFKFEYKLFQIDNMSVSDICNQCNVTKNDVCCLFKVLRHYGFAIIHDNHIIFSPLLIIYNLRYFIIERNKYLMLLSKDKYGKQYLSNHSLRYKINKSLKH